MKQRGPIQRNALVVAGGLTAFALVLTGGLTSRVSHDLARGAATPSAEPPTAVPTQGLDPAVQALIDQRESAYRQQLANANRQLEAANQRLQDAYKAAEDASAAAQAAVAQAAAAQAAAPPQPAYIPPDQAAALALQAAPGASLGQAPSLVNYQGVAAYDVVTDRGDVVIDATNGTVLYNGTSQPVAMGGGGHEHEHEGDDDHGDDD
jgi:uncharacterized membrane protein YkoI